MINKIYNESTPEAFISGIDLCGEVWTIEDWCEVSNAEHLAILIKLYDDSGVFKDMLERDEINQNCIAVGVEFSGDRALYVWGEGGLYGYEKK